MALSREDADKILRTNLANILSKLKAGKTLTTAERALIEAQAAGGATDTAFAANFEELADFLKISRRGLLKVRKRFESSLPKARPDGRHDVAAWSRFFVAHNINGAAIDAEPDGPEDSLIETSEAEWRKRELREKVAKLQLQNALTRRELIELAEIQEVLPPFLMKIRTDMNQLVSDLAADLEGIDDFYEREEIIQARVDQLLGMLAGCAWLDEKPQSADYAPAPELNQIRIKKPEKVKPKPPRKLPAKPKKKRK